MPQEILPDDPSVKAMLRWIAATYHMPQAALARMFGRSGKTIHAWMGDGGISHENLMRIRASYYHFHNTKDPHSQERKCARCGRWRPTAQFHGHAAACAACAPAPRSPTPGAPARADRTRTGRGVKALRTVAMAVPGKTNRN